MYAYTAPALVVLTEAYTAATKIPPTRLGLIVANNSKLFTSLLAGKDVTTATAERATEFFDLNWPPTLPWPAEVTRRPQWMLYKPQIRAPRKPATPRYKQRAARKGQSRNPGGSATATA